MADSPIQMPGSGVSDETVLKHAEVLALRQISDTLRVVSQEMIAHRADLGQIKIDIAVMKVRQESQDQVAETCKAMQEQIDELKARNLKEDGAVTFLTFLKDFGPWLMALVMAYLALFRK